MKSSQIKTKLSSSIIAQLLCGNPVPARNNAHLLQGGSFSPAFILWLINHAVKSLKAEVRAVTEEEAKAIEKFHHSLEKGEYDQMIEKAILAEEAALAKKTALPKNGGPEITH